MSASARVRIGVVGCGMVAQAMHLHHLAGLRDRFDLVSIAEPSRTVRDAIAARYAVPRAYDDARALLDDGGLDAILVAAPAATHADVVLAALDAGVHVVVEKPLCITPKGADGLLERIAEPLPVEVADAAWWAGGRSITGSARLANGARWDSVWIQLLDVREYRESVTFYFADSIRSLQFPSPWLKQSPTRYERSEADGAARDVRIVESHEESFLRELVHFHDCITTGAECRTPPEQARLDIELLTNMFLAAR